MRDNEYRSVIFVLGALSVSALVFFLTELRNTSLERPILRSQRAAAWARRVSLQSGNAEADQILEKRELQIARMQKLEADYAQLLTDLLELAKVDPDARAVTNKWKIQQQAQSPPSEAAAPVSSALETKPRAVPTKGRLVNPLAPGIQ